MESFALPTRSRQRSSVETMRTLVWPSAPMAIPGALPMAGCTPGLSRRARTVPVLLRANARWGALERSAHVHPLAGRRAPTAPPSAPGAKVSLPASQPRSGSGAPNERLRCVCDARKGVLVTDAQLWVPDARNAPRARMPPALGPQDMRGAKARKRRSPERPAVAIGGAVGGLDRPVTKGQRREWLAAGAEAAVSG